MEGTPIPAGQHRPSEPYKGLHYFTLQDRAFFHGRDGEADRLVTMIGNNPISYVYASSGAGKTSLIRSAVVPEAEDDGRKVVYCRSSEDPSRTVRAATLLRLVPPPAAELRALRAMLEKLEGAGTEITMLDELQKYWRGLPPRHPLHRDLIADVELPADDPMKQRGADDAARSRVMARAIHLRTGSFELYRYLHRISRLTGLADRAPPPPAEFQRMALADLEGRLSDQELQTAHASLVKELIEAPATLVEFFRNIGSKLGLDDEDIEIVLIIDQFEEFFTLFADPDAVGVQLREGIHDYRIRRRFFEELGQLLKAWQTGTTPVRIMLSLRHDYIARLAELEEFIGAPFTNAQRYQLPRLSIEALPDVIERPAKEFGVRFEPDALAAISSGLKLEDRFAEPAHIQIVCTKLWDEFGRNRAVPADAPLPDKEEMRQITQEDLDSLGGVREILGNHFDEFLQSIESDLDRVEIMDILGSMATPEGTRRLATRESLENVPFHDPASRRKAIKRLRDASIIQVEPHRGGDIVEITHEFLLKPITVAGGEIRKDFPRWEDVRLAIHTIETSGWSTRLNYNQLGALYWYREKLAFPPSNTDLARYLLRETVLWSNHDADAGEWKEIRDWAELLARDDSTGTAAISVDDIEARAAARPPRQLRSDEIRCIDFGSLTEAVSAGALAYLLDEIVREAAAEDAARVLGDLFRHAR
jgi:hypothetical protein